jgi:hypothetical protein
MNTKLISALMALLALGAFVLPATVSASPVITHPTGTILNPSKGSCAGVSGTVCIVGTNIGISKLKTDPSGSTAPAVLTECSTTTITGYLEKNTGTLIEGTIITATSQGTGPEVNGMHECTGASGIIGNVLPTLNGGGVDGENITNGTPLCVKSGPNDTGTLRGGKCSEEPRKMTMVLDATKLFEPTKFNECKYERTNAFEGTVTTDTTGDAIVSVSPGSTEAEKAKSTIKGETGNSIECPATGTLEVAYTIETDTATTEPLYIS